MTIKFTAIIILVFVVLLTLCGCLSQSLAGVNIDADKNSNVDSSDKNPSDYDRVVYVSGAVQNDGYVTVPQICDYKSLLNIAGITNSTATLMNISTLIPNNSKCIVFNFMLDGTEYFSVNVNGGLILTRSRIDGIEADIINKLADYIETNGKITNRNMLKTALGDDYEDNYYKFYIDIDDYAQNS